MLAEGEYEGNGGFVCFDDRTGVVLLFRGENAKSLDILSREYLRNGNYGIITQPFL